VTQIVLDYHQLVKLDPVAWPGWVRAHCTSTPPAQWWLAIVDRAEADLDAQTPEGRQGLMEFAASWITFAAESGGLPHYHAASRLCRLARLVRDRFPSLADLPEALTPDGAARRALTRVVLSPDRARAAAEHRRQELMVDENAWARPGVPVTEPPPADEELDQLQELEWLLDDLVPLADEIQDPGLAATVRRWLDLRGDLDIGSEAARRGRELLARWSADHAGGAGLAT
jgi:hypothetical protein